MYSSIVFFLREEGDWSIEGCGGAAKKADAEGTPAAKAEAGRLRRKRCGGGAKGRQRRGEQQDIGKFLALCVDTATSPEQHYMKIAERNAEAASTSQQ